MLLLCMCLQSRSADTVSHLLGHPQFEWNVDFTTVFDNREGDSHITPTKTFFETRLAPTLGASWQEGRHTVMAGADWSQPVGTSFGEGRLSPTVYYAYRSRGVRGALGAFPRTLLIRKIPNYIWNDSSYYTQADIRGGAVGIETPSGFAEGILDWRGLQSESRREAFNIIVRGEWTPGRSRRWIAGALGMMNHFALTLHSPSTEHIVDDMLFNLYVGTDLSRDLPVDSLSVRLGILGSHTRQRGGDPWQSGIGAWSEIALRWRRLGIDNTFYAGGRLFPYFTQFGAALHQGEPYYSTKWYDRLTAFITIAGNGVLDLRAALDLNFSQSNFTCYQRLLLGVTFGSRPRNPKRLLP